MTEGINVMRTGLGWMFITANPEIAQYAESYGVHRIFVDMETAGKEKRQKKLSAHFAAHTIKDVAVISSALKKSELLVRINPLDSNSAYEIDSVIDSGAQRLMLPMFRKPEEVYRFQELVGGRVPITLLAETIQAVSRLSVYVDSLNTSDEVYFGLNDLSLDMGLNFLFEPLAARTFELGTKLLLERNIKFGFGGIARLGDGELASELILSEHVRLGSNWVILSRAFHQNANSVLELGEKLNLADELEKLRQAEAALHSSDVQLEYNRLCLEREVFLIARRGW